MARAVPDLHARTVTLDTGRRTIDVPVDGAGHVRRLAKLDERSITRAAGAGAPIGFKGHAALFNNRTWIGSKRWGFWEEIAPGAFAKTLQEADVRMLINHNPDLICARNVAGTLRLAEDDIGLDVDADMAPTSYVGDLAVSLERGDVTQMSFAFDMISYEWTELADGTELLRHLEVGLWDVSPVTYPAYTDTDASLRLDILAAARNAGMGGIDVNLLAGRLADPDPELLAALSDLARSTPARPAETTGPDTSAPAETTRTEDPGPPAETTGSRAPHPLALRTLVQRTASMKERI